MTTFTTEDRLRVIPQLGTKWRGTDGEKEFVIQAIWNPNEEPDAWVRYTDNTLQEYTCRLEAFLSRFTQRPTER
jgi:hypothetical protein